jgi:hypothetical protein
LQIPNLPNTQFTTRLATHQHNIFQLVAAFMMIEALNKKGVSAFAISIPSPKEFLQIFAIAAPVFVTMFSKVYFVLLSSIALSAHMGVYLCICVFLMFRWHSILS